MPAFHEDIVRLTAENTDFRREIRTEKHSQLVVMCVEPDDEIGEEVHAVDQILFFVRGEGEAVLDGKRSKVKPNDLVIVPAGTRHNFIVKGKEPLRLFTIYAPAEEDPGTLHRTHADADAAEAAEAE